MIKTFKGLLADGSQDKIRLSTKQGLIGYRITKFQAMPNDPMAADGEHILKIWSVEQDTGTIDGNVNFNSPHLLAVSTVANETDGKLYPININMVVDNKVINQSIYVTHSDIHGNTSCNYYIELEQLKLDLGEATVATLKDMRGRE
jgi:hypothetical protein